MQEKNSELESQVKTQDKQIKDLETHLQELGNVHFVLHIQLLHILICYLFYKMAEKEANQKEANLQKKADNLEIELHDKENQIKGIETKYEGKISELKNQLQEHGRDKNLFLIFFSIKEPEKVLQSNF